MTEDQSGRFSMDDEALRVLLASGILKSDVTIEQLAELSERLSKDTVLEAGFIFRDFLFRPC